MIEEDAPMKKLSILLICFISIGCIAIGLCSCTEEERETVDKPSVSERFHYNELIQALSKMESISKKDAGAKVAAMQLSDTTSDLEQYRIVSLPAEQNKKHYTLRFILISDEKNSDWEIQSIESAVVLTYYLFYIARYAAFKLIYALSAPFFIPTIFTISAFSQVVLHLRNKAFVTSLISSNQHLLGIILSTFEKPYYRH